MDKVKICLKTQDSDNILLKINRMKEKNGILTIFLDGDCNISVSDIVIFSRSVLNSENKYINVGDYRASVLSVEKSNNVTTIKINSPEDFMIQVSDFIRFDENYYQINCINNHNIFSQDLMQLNEDLNLYYKDSLKNEIGNICKLGDIRLKEYTSYFKDDIVEPKYCLFNIDLKESYNECEDIGTFYLTPDFLYDKDDIDKMTFFIRKDDDMSEKVYMGLYLPYNIFYHIVDTDNMGYSICELWGDYDEYDDIGNRIDEIPGYSGYNVEYISKDKDNTYSKIMFYKDDIGYKISFGLSQNIDYKHLYQEENVRNIFTKKVKEAVVDNVPIIDMEKVKFAPYIPGNNISVSAITFNLHFRTREDLQESWRYVKDTYYSNHNHYWNPDYCVKNGIYNIDSIYDYSDIESHIKTEVNTNNNSDMLYYLGFTDEDVQNQKNKIKKSFLRLTFYDDTNPLTQKLLYYSTVFMDSGELFGKYVKAKSELKANGEEISKMGVVLDSYKTNNRLDCKFVIRDEFYAEKSSEGFNIYYFPDDVILSENSEKTIYMKVEFNHAGFGRTIPMIACGGVQTMSLSTYKERLYIELKLKYINGKYIYVVSNKFNDNLCILTKGSTYEFNLFEPIIDGK